MATPSKRALGVVARGQKETILIKSALKGSNHVISHTVKRSGNHNDEGPLIASDHSDSEHFDGGKHQLGQYTHVREAKPLDADIYRVTKRKSKHKVRHDVYSLDVKVFDLLQMYADAGAYPPDEVLLHVSRLYQYEHINEYLAEIKVQASATHIIADGPKGGKYRLSSKTGKKRYLQ